MTSTGAVARRPLGVSVTPFETRADVILRLGQRADEVGLDHVSIPEGWTHDGFVLLAEIAMRTSRVGLYAGIISVWSRSAAAIAMGAASLQRCSGGRLSLGLGATRRRSPKGCTASAGSVPSITCARS